MLKRTFVLCSVLIILCLAFASLAMAKFSLNLNRAVDAGTDAFKAATLSDADLVEMSKEMRATEDKKQNIAASNSDYGKRIANIAKSLKSVNGKTLDYKVYITKDVNANAAPDGSIRVYSGLMDMMTDDELLFVLGHEVGHVANGDTLARFKTAYAASAGRKAVGAVGATGAALSDSALGDISEAFLNAQFSQSQERAADDYGFKTLKDHKKDTKAAESALLKLAKLGGGKGSMFSTHPDPEKRAARMAQQAQK